MKHASEIFPVALAELFKLAEQGKARNPRTTRKGDRVMGDRETIRVVRREKRARQTELQFN